MPSKSKHQTGRNDHAKRTHGKSATVGNPEPRKNLFPAGLDWFLGADRGGVDSLTLDGLRFAGLAIVEYLTVASLLILIFTIVWFHRHTRLAKRIADPQTCPPVSSVIRSVWTGLMASSIGLLFSMIVMMIETGHMLFYFLAAPQGGVPVIQTTGADPASWVSAVDMMSLMALSLSVFTELVVLILSLWLLFRTMQVSAEFPPAPAQ